MSQTATIIRSYTEPQIYVIGDNKNVEDVKHAIGTIEHIIDPIVWYCLLTVTIEHQQYRLFLWELKGINEVSDGEVLDEELDGGIQSIKFLMEKFSM
jgi:hypothetical protein